MRDDPTIMDDLVEQTRDYFQTLWIATVRALLAPEFRESIARDLEDAATSIVEVAETVAWALLLLLFLVFPPLPIIVGTIVARSERRADRARLQARAERDNNPLEDE